MIHPLLERELGELTLRLTKCNGVWHGCLVERFELEDETIWQSRGEDNREAVETAAANFAAYGKTEVKDIDAEPMTATTGGNQIELVQDRDGRFRWHAAEGDTEVSGATVAEACERAQAAWADIEFGFTAETA